MDDRQHPFSAATRFHVEPTCRTGSVASGTFGYIYIVNTPLCLRQHVDCTGTATSYRQPRERLMRTPPPADSFNYTK
eukprot:scaffold88545_cov28-Attheya_sp.AAC.1